MRDKVANAIRIVGSSFKWKILLMIRAKTTGTIRIVSQTATFRSGTLIASRITKKNPARAPAQKGLIVKAYLKLIANKVMATRLIIQIINVIADTPFVEIEMARCKSDTLLYLIMMVMSIDDRW